LLLDFIYAGSPGKQVQEFASNHNPTSLNEHWRCYKTGE
jgi:hypothetical protein